MPTPNSQSSSLLVSVGVECNVGRERKENQDRVSRAATPFGDLFVVADGVGGYQGGAEAAQTTVDGFAAHLKSHGNLPLSEALQQAVRSVSADLQKRSAADPALRGMGSTVVLCVVNGNRAIYAHAGDSRVYLVRDRKLTQLTRDHSVMERLVSGGVLTPAQAREHPDASVLTRAIGQASDVELDIAEITLQPGDALLLCSDGLWGYAEHEEMEAVATSENMSPSGVASALLNLALEGGGGDNISIQFLRFSGLQSPKSSRSKLLIPVALASVLAVGTGVMFVSNYRHPLVSRPQDTDADASSSTKQAPPETPKTPKSGEKKPTQPKAEDKQPAGTPTEPPAHKSPVKLKVEVIVLKAQGRTADWAEQLNHIEGVTTSARDANEGCLSALQRDTAVLYYAAKQGAEAQRIGNDQNLGLSPEEIRLATPEQLKACGGGELLAMPAKPPLGQRAADKAREEVQQKAGQVKAGYDSLKKKLEEKVQQQKDPPTP
jgi:protein phosphatase